METGVGNGVSEAGTAAEAEAVELPSLPRYLTRAAVAETEEEDVVADAAEEVETGLDNGDSDDEAVDADIHRAAIRPLSPEEEEGRLSVEVVDNEEDAVPINVTIFEPLDD